MPNRELTRQTTATRGTTVGFLVNWQGRPYTGAGRACAGQQTRRL